MCRPRFIADTMLGTLTKRLRLLGIDTAYVRDADDSELKYIVRSQERILLTKDRNLAGSLGSSAWLIDGEDVGEEFTSIARNLAVHCVRLNPFSRCLDCNAPLIAADPSEVGGKVPPYILSTKPRFLSCSLCKKVFWEGTHRKRMEGQVEWMEMVLEEEKIRENR